MKLSLQNDPSPFEFETYGELLDKAQKIERAQKQLEEHRREGNKKRSFQNFKNQNQNWHNNKRGNNNNFNNRNNININNNNDQRVRMKCSRCGRQHEAKDCPMTTGACYYCKEMGHLAAKCPKKT